MKAVTPLKIVFLSVVLALVLTACATSDRVTVESANQDSRVAVVVIHHTVGDFHDSLVTLTEPSSRPVSSHYLVPEPGDPSYPDKKLRVYQLVDEDQRAWHAGSGSWRELNRLNNVSVGIEMVNRTYCHRPENRPVEGNADWPADTLCFYPDYPDSQLAMLVDLLEDILARHTEVKPTHVVGHSDIAPQRKIDPGPRFPWQRLYKLGYGAWYDDETVIRYWEQFSLEMPDITQIQQALKTYGYGIELTGEADEQTRNVLRAFQMHFLPYRVSSEATLETAATLFALVEKYYPDELDAALHTENMAEATGDAAFGG